MFNTDPLEVTTHIQDIALHILKWCISLLSVTITKHLKLGTYKRSVFISLSQKLKVQDHVASFVQRVEDLSGCVTWQRCIKGNDHGQKRQVCNSASFCNNISMRTNCRTPALISSGFDAHNNPISPTRSHVSKILSSQHCHSGDQVYRL